MMIYKFCLRLQFWVGESVGIIVFDCFYLFILGNVVNVMIYDFLVCYVLVEGVMGEKLLYYVDDLLLFVFIVVVQKFQDEGVLGIIGVCGFMVLFQCEIVVVVDILVFVSSLLQVNFMYQIIGKCVGVICVDLICLKFGYLVGIGVLLDVLLVVIGMEGCVVFNSGICVNIGEFDDDVLC